MKLKTINVVEVTEGEVLGVHSFPNNKDGRREAKICMYDVIKESSDLLDEEIEECVKRKVYDEGDLRVQLIVGE